MTRIYGADRLSTSQFGMVLDQSSLLDFIFIALYLYAISTDFSSQSKLQFKWQIKRSKFILLWHPQRSSHTSSWLGLLKRINAGTNLKARILDVFKESPSRGTTNSRGDIIGTDLQIQYQYYLQYFACRLGDVVWFGLSCINSKHRIYRNKIATPQTLAPVLQQID